MKRKYRDLLQNILLLFVTLTIFFAVFEIVMRVIYPDETDRQFIEYDSLLGWKNKANTEGIHKISESTSSVKINSKELRDEEYEYTKDSGTFRILVFGDSFTWGYGVEAEEIYTEVLEDKLGDDFEVINMGVPGYGADQEYLLLKREGIKYAPDLVIFGFDVFTDACDVYNPVRYRYYSKPKFDLLDGKLVLTNVPVPISPKFYQKINRIFSGLRSYIFIRDRILSVTFIRQKLAETLQYSNHSKCDDSVRESEDIRNLVSKLISEADGFMKSNNGELAVVIMPSRWQIYEGASTFQNDFLREFGQEQNIKTIDLLTGFKESAERGADLYYKKDAHWNKEGHELAAELIYEGLINENLVLIK